jgi:hypothetical protein
MLELFTGSVAHLVLQQLVPKTFLLLGSVRTFVDDGAALFHSDSVLRSLP